MDHGLHCVSDMHQLEELQERGDALRLFMLVRLVRLHLLNSTAGSESAMRARQQVCYLRVKPGLDMALAQRLE